MSTSLHYSYEIQNYLYHYTYLPKNWLKYINKILLQGDKELHNKNKSYQVNKCEEMFIISQQLHK